MKVFVTGAAGFIGSVVTQLLVEGGHEVTGFDSLKNGHRAAVHPDAKFVKGDLLDAELLRSAVAEAQPDAVVHLAAEAYIDLSIIDPGLFFHANVTGGVNLLEAMRAIDCKRIVFSSTAAVYGEPQYVPIDEDHPKDPVNAYGESKLQFERIMAWYRRSFDLRHVSFRYFNACGATNLYGEAREKETHIIPLLFEVAQGKRQQFSLFGTDYPTPDGTCVRDYVHAVDIANAHILALGKIDELGARAYNIGAGTGYTNRQVVEAVREVTGHPIPVVDADRRIGDPAVLVASADRIREELGWERQFNDLRSMVQSAWDWRLSHPQGYAQ